MRHRFFFSLNAQFENLGDEIINGQLIKGLSRRGSVVALTSGVPDWYASNIKSALSEESLNVEFIKSPFLFWMRVFSARFTRTPAWLVTSCGDITETSETALKDIALAILTNLLGLGIASIGISFSSMNQSRIRFWRTKRHGLRVIGPRDQKTAHFLRTSGIAARLIPDLAFGLPFECANTDRPIALISLRETNVCPTILNQSIEAVIAANNVSGLEIATTWQVDFDEPLSKRMADLFKLKLINPKSRTDARQDAIESIYDQCKIVISNRLHVLILAASRGAVPVPLLAPSETKVRSIFEDMGLGRQIIEVDRSTNTQSVLLAIRLAAAEDYQKKFSDYSIEIEEFFSSSFG